MVGIALDAVRDRDTSHDPGVRAGTAVLGDEPSGGRQFYPVFDGLLLGWLRRLV
jgi:hypothetical protein